MCAWAVWIHPRTTADKAGVYSDVTLFLLILNIATIIASCETGDNVNVMFS